MKVAIDIQPLIGKKTGVGYYTAGILRALSNIDKKNDYSLVLFSFLTTKISKPIIFESKNFKYKLIRFLPGRVFGKLLKLNLLPPLDLFLGKRIYLFPNFVSWPLTFSKYVVVIYDLSYELHGHFSDDQNRRFLKKHVPRSAKKASLIITISENSKNEIVDHYGVDPKKVIIAPPAIDPLLFKPASNNEIKRIQEKYQLPENFFLYVGTLEPRKNIIGILDSYKNLPREIKNEHPLVLAGGKGWKDSAIGEKINELKKANENILQTGYFKEEDLPGLYSAATAFVYPSHYEGFGMPPLEAMACGTPVITSNNSSLPEVVGDAAITVEASDTKAITDAMLRIINDDKLARELKAKGLLRARIFSWDDSAKKILSELEKI